MTPHEKAVALQAEMEAEIGALLPFASYTAAIEAIEGKNGVPAIRRKYLNRLYAAQAEGNLSDPFVIGIADALNFYLSRQIALLAPVNDREHANGIGCIISSYVWTLTPEERAQL